MSKTVEFTEEAVKAYLDRRIAYWRQTLEEAPATEYAKFYIDAFQSVRLSLFGEALPSEDNDFFN